MPLPHNLLHSLGRPILESDAMIAVPERMFGQIVLVCGFRLDKSGVVDNSGTDFLLRKCLDFLFRNQRLQLLFHFESNLHLLLIGTKNDAAILAPPIIPLSISGGGIVEGEKESNQCFEEFWGWIVQLDVQDFNVSRISSTDLFVTWIFERIVGIDAHESHLGIGNRLWKPFLKVLDNEFFSAPITTRTERKCR